MKHEIHTITIPIFTNEEPNMQRANMQTPGGYEVPEAITQALGLGPDASVDDCVAAIRAIGKPAIPNPTPAPPAESLSMRERRILSGRSPEEIAKYFQMMRGIKQRSYKAR